MHAVAVVGDVGVAARGSVEVPVAGRTAVAAEVAAAEAVAVVAAGIATENRRVACC
jgi:hypothetical protein